MSVGVVKIATKPVYVRMRGRKGSTDDGVSTGHQIKQSYYDEKSGCVTLVTLVTNDGSVHGELILWKEKRNFILESSGTVLEHGKVSECGKYNLGYTYLNTFILSNGEVLDLWEVWAYPI